MKKLLEALIVASLLVGCANAQGPGARIYFDLDGNVPMSQNENDAPHPGATAQENPTVENGAGRLYIYWQFGAADQFVLSPNYDITVDDGSIDWAWNYNDTNIGNIGFDRWEPLPNAQNPADYAVEPWNFPGGPAFNPTAGTNPISFTSAAILAFGLSNDAAHQGFDNQLAIGDGPFGSTLLGYVDVSLDPGQGLATVWLTVGEHGIAFFAGFLINFGFGDDPVSPGEPGIRTTIADAVIVPEPTGLMLLGLGVLVLRRRR